ncbi:MAG: LacI family DNA-binding transcriptional regulator [Bacteroidota bacterium]
MNQRKIAQLAGVSSATVSRVINNKSVSKETLAKVQRVIAENGYVPDTIAKSLRTKNTRTIGFVIPDIGNPFFPEVLRGVEAVCVARKYHIILGNTNEDRETEKQVVRHLREKRVDGMVMILVDETGGTVQSQFARGGLEWPIVTIDRHIEGFGCDSVIIDNVGGSFNAIKYLAELGHRRIAIIHGPKNVTPGIERLQGFLKAVEAFGLEARPEYIREGDFRTKSGYDLASELVRLPEPPTAIFGGNNLMTIGAFEALRDLGLRIPEQISLVGFDDFLLAGYLTPPITVVDRPMVDMGRIAAELLLDRIEKKDCTVAKKIVLPTSLKIRQSCCRVS